MSLGYLAVGAVCERVDAILSTTGAVTFYLSPDHGVVGWVESLQFFEERIAVRVEENLVVPDQIS